MERCDGIAILNKEQLKYYRMICCTANIHCQKQETEKDKEKQDLQISRQGTLTLRRLMLYIYIYIYGAPILDVSRSHTTTHHSP